MLMNFIKLLTFLLMRRGIINLKQQVLDIGQDAAAHIEQRGEEISKELYTDIDRITASFIGFLIVLVGIIFSGMILLMWLFALAWTSPNRDLILGLSVTIPIFLSGIIYFNIHKNWKQKPFLFNSKQSIAKDWYLFRSTLDANSREPNEDNQ